MNQYFFMFPGQGSQRVGMGGELISQSKVARAVFEEANDTLGFDLKTLCLEGPVEKLNLTKYTQPAILTASIAAWSLIKDKIEPDHCVFAGHSLGEYSALVAAGKLDFANAVLAVHSRGSFMQEAVKEGVGSMAAVLGCEPEDIRKVCQSISSSPSEVVEVANYNAPTQTVISGFAGSVQKAAALLKEKYQAKSIFLPVSASFHCSLMQGARLNMVEVLAKLPMHKNEARVAANVDGKIYTDNYDKDLLLRQIDSSVNWTETLCNIYGLGFRQFVEVGPGRVLSGLAKKCGLSEAIATQAFDIQSIKNIL